MKPILTQTHVRIVRNFWHFNMAFISARSFVEGDIIIKPILTQTNVRNCFWHFNMTFIFLLFLLALLKSFFFTFVILLFIYLYLTLYYRRFTVFKVRNKNGNTTDLD